MGVYVLVKSSLVQHFSLMATLRSKLPDLHAVR